MKNPDSSKAEQGETCLYEIRIKGHLSDRWVARFEGMKITREEGGDTLLTGPVVDQAALHGLLKKVRDAGLPLISVCCVRSETRATDGNPAQEDKEMKK